MEPKLPLEKELEPIFLEKFPAFPEEVKEFIVNYGPFLMLLGAIITAFGLLAALGLGGVALGLGAAAYGSTLQFWLSIALTGVQLVLYFMAFSPLRARKREGWKLLYYALLLGLLSSLIQLSIFGLLIGGLVGFWVLFQIRDKYSFQITR
ncbi:hypothetical protein GCM10027275_47940 [Rhabdobacter roseus]|uniref:Uncharacterized protein n=1 Tax=Rhabdobacter roseus TaxID=1655419 RepID=A0A840TR18_9BACT|nr:hypothetical protein [Rhabdobacter roseus]MBB5286321.1 hypothetical protein [Rhabdobacter roseus]